MARLPAWVAAACAALTGCATAPPAPPAPTAPAQVVAAPIATDSRVTQAIARHRQQATEYRRAGDYASEAAQWQILTLLAPDEPVFARELATARAAIAATVQEQSQAGNAAMIAGDLDRAGAAYLRVLAADPANAEAAKQMREVDRRRLAKIQAAAATRAARAGGASMAAADNGDGFDLDQAFELFRAGDTAAGLREFRMFVDANPTNRGVRQRIGAVVADRAKELEDEGSRDQALAMYEQASSLRGDSAGPWVPRIAALRKALSVEAYDKALRVYRTDLAQAVRLLETSVKYDPANTLAASRLKEARVAQANLSKMEQRGKAK